MSVPTERPQVCFYPTPEEKAALVALAAKEQRSVAQVCMMIIRGELPPISTKVRK